MTLEESIAKLNLGLMGMSMMPEIAMKTLEQGVESESLIILAGMNDGDSSYEIEGYLIKVIEELKIKVYQANEAAFVMANYYVDQVKQGALTAIKAIYYIKNDCWENTTVTIASKEFLFDSIDFEGIIGSWYQYYEIDENPNWVMESNKSTDEIKKEIEGDLKHNLFEWQKDFLVKELNKMKNKL